MVTYRVYFLDGNIKLFGALSLMDLVKHLEENGWTNIDCIKRIEK